MVDVMDAHPTKPAVRCRTCRRAPDDGQGLRRGLCRACYLRAWRGAELPDGAACVTCRERRRMVLRWTRLGTSAKKIITCQNCGFIADRMRPRPLTVDELEDRLARERRRARDRRSNYVIDPRDPAERRLEPRRVRRRAPG
jgi:NMD protein affecting ribosome stability and mRNA decay